eukprot:Seg276.3 transcript_id=Seg276.3/GoldUCD/mRNA.D3Y31 product="MAP3K12-binding inhibitory protein 1" protein_id=Seg276.3/GoldUCD/D3Y31
MATSGLGHEGIAAFRMELLSQTATASDIIVSKMEEYLMKVFGYPKAFLMVLAKASFGRSPVPIVGYESFIKKTWMFLKDIEDIMNSMTSISSEVNISTGNASCYQHVGTQTNSEEKNDGLVQITASTDEINRRINSFIQRKRQEVDAYNRREFCVFRDNKEESTCARTDAAYVPRHGKKSLMKIYRVYNKLDAESPTNTSKRSWRKGFDDVWEPSHPSTSLALRHIPAETYERIENVERHLLTPRELAHKRDNSQSSSGVLGTIKKLENRILYLEGLSLEYFNQGSKVTKNKARHHPYKSQATINKQNKEVALMDKRISELRNILQSKSYGSKKS